MPLRVVRSSYRSFVFMVGSQHLVHKSKDDPQFWATNSRHKQVKIVSVKYISNLYISVSANRQNCF